MRGTVVAAASELARAASAAGEPGPDESPLEHDPQLVAAALRMLQDLHDHDDDDARDRAVRRIRG